MKNPASSGIGITRGRSTINMFLCDKRSKLVYDTVMLSCLSVIHFGIQPWEDLQILVSVTVLPILGDLRFPRASLLLSLPRLDPLLSS